MVYESSVRQYLVVALPKELMLYDGRSAHDYINGRVNDACVQDNTFGLFSQFIEY